MTPPVTLAAAANVTTATLSANLSAAFGAMNMSAASSSTFTIHGSQTGKLSGAYSGGGTPTLTFDPAANLKPGEDLELTLTQANQSSTGGTLAHPYVWRLRTASDPSPALTIDAAVLLGDVTTTTTAELAADLDGDGRVDLILGRKGQSVILKNGGLDSSGQPMFAGYNLGDNSNTTASLVVADFNGDGKLDIALGRWGGQTKVYLNAGSMNFSSSVSIGGSTDMTTALAAGDVDGDGDIDLVVARYGQQSKVYLNNGSGSFPSTIDFGGATDPTMAVALADVDGHGDLDIIAGNYNAQSNVYINDGAAGFGLSVNFGGATDKTKALALGDLDLDGDVDIVAGNDGGQSRVYFNSGASGFNSSENFGGAADPTRAISLADIDGDGDLDLLVANYGAQSRVYTTLAAGSPQRSVFRPDMEALSTPSRNGWWPALWGTGTQSGQYVVDASRGNVVRLSTTASGASPGAFMIGQGWLYGTDNPNDAPLMPEGSTVHTMMGFWVKANGTGQVPQFRVKANTSSGGLTMNLYTASGSDSSDLGNWDTFRIGSSYNDGAWHYAEVDLQSCLSGVNAGRVITAIYGIEVLARDIYLDDIVFFDKPRSTVGAAGQLIGGPHDAAYAILAADLTGDAKADFSLARYGRSVVRKSSVIQTLGAEWPRALNTNAASDNTNDPVHQSADANVRIAAGENGVWMAVWTSNTDLQISSGVSTGTDWDILYSISHDVGNTWDPPKPLNPGATTSSTANYDLTPDIAYGGNGKWMVVWSAMENVSVEGTLKGSDSDILAVSTSDNGTTWTATTLVSKWTQGDSSDDSPRIARGADRWVVAWSSLHYGADYEICAAELNDQGGSGWSTPVRLTADHPNKHFDSVNVNLAANGKDRWIAVWASIPTDGQGHNPDVNFQTGSQVKAAGLTVSGGVSTWGPESLIAWPGSDSAFNQGTPDVACDGDKNWVIAFASTVSSAGGSQIGSDQDILAVYSADDGANWSAPVLLNSNGASDNGNNGNADQFDDLIAIGRKAFISVWHTYGNFGNNYDVLASYTLDGGAHWSPRALVNLNGNIATGQGANPAFPVVAADLNYLNDPTNPDSRAPRILAAWQSTDTLEGNLPCVDEIGSDWDILFTPLLLNPPQRTLTVTSDPAGASITSDPSLPSPPKFDHGTIVTLTATQAHQRRDFSHWQIGGCDMESGERTASFVLDRDLLAQAVYAYQLPSCSTIGDVTPVSSSELQVTWTNAPSNAETIRVYYYPFTLDTPDLHYVEIDADAAAPSGSTVLSALASGTLYEVYVSAWNPSGESDCSANIAGAYTMVRLTVDATGAPSGADVNFSVTVGEDSPITLAAGGQHDFALGTQLTIAAPSFPLRDFMWNVGEGTTAAYSNPIALDLTEDKTATAEYASGLTPPVLDQPQPGSCGISLSWTDRSITWGEDHFQIYRRRTNPSEETDFTLIGSTVGPHVTNFIDDLGLEVGATYEYAVRASWGPLLSALSNVESATAALIAPPTVAAAFPAPEAVNVDSDSAVAVGFGAAVATPSAPLIVYGSLTGKMSIGQSSYNSVSHVVASLPGDTFKLGELIQVTAVDQIHTTANPPGNLCSGYVWQFRAKAGGSQPVTPNFAAARSFGPRIGATRALAMGDLDHDSNHFLDIVAGNAGGSFVYINTGGSFSPGQNNPRRLGPAEDAILSVVALALGDMDADGDLDVVAAVEGGQSKIYWNDGAGNFETGNAFGPSASGVTSVAVGDMNGDGLLDIVVGNLGAWKVVYLNDGAGGFPDELARPFGSASESTMAVALADFNRDGHLDVAVGNFGQQSLVYLNDGFGNLTAGPVFGEGTESTFALAVGDVTGDGNADIVMGNHGGLGGDADAGEANVIYKSVVTSGAFTGFDLADTLALADRTTAVALADLDGDGKLDLVVANDSETASAYALINPTGNLGHFSSSTPIAIGSGSPNWAIAIGDVGGSGIASSLDVALGGLSGESAVYVSLAVTPTPAPTPTPTPTYSNVPDFCMPAGTDLSSTPTAADLRPRAINDYGRGDTGGDADVSIATDGLGHWVAVWASDENIYIPGQGPVGPDRDIFISRMWAPPVRPGDFSPDLRDDDWYSLYRSEYQAPEITTGGLGNPVQADFESAVLYKWMEARPLTSDMTSDYSPNSASEIIEDINPHVETDGHGKWMVVWLAQLGGLGDSSNAVPYELVHSISLDDTGAWSPRKRVKTACTQGNGPIGHFVEPLSPRSFIRANPKVVSDRQADSKWILVWDSWQKSVCGGDFAEDTDYDLLLTSVSMTNGAFPAADGDEVWEPVKTLNTQTDDENAQPAQDGGPSGLWENGANLATDGQGNWIAVWHSDRERVATDSNFPNALVNVGRDLDILYSKSTNNGINWSPPVLLNSFGASDNGIDSDPKIDVWKDDQNIPHWVVVWRSAGPSTTGPGVPTDIYSSRMVGMGGDWSRAARISGDRGEGDHRINANPTLASDGKGYWVSAWIADNEETGERLNAHPQLRYARSGNDGITWEDQSSACQFQNSVYPGDTWNVNPKLVSDRAYTGTKIANFVLGWEFVSLAGGEWGEDPDILNARSSANLYPTTWPLDFEPPTPTPTPIPTQTPAPVAAAAATYRFAAAYPLGDADEMPSPTPTPLPSVTSIADEDSSRWLVPNPGESGPYAVVLVNSDVIPGGVAGLAKVEAISLEYALNLPADAGIESSIWVFKGGYRSGSDWRDSSAWERIRGPEQPTNPLSGDLEVPAPLQANLIQYLNEPVAPESTPVPIAGLTRAAGSLTWAIQVKQTSGQALSSFDFDRISAEVSLHVTPTATPTPTPTPVPTPADTDTKLYLAATLDVFQANSSVTDHGPGRAVFKWDGTTLDYEVWVDHDSYPQSTTLRIGSSATSGRWHASTTLNTVNLPTALSDGYTSRSITNLQSGFGGALIPAATNPRLGQLYIELYDGGTIILRGQIEIDSDTDGISDYEEYTGYLGSSTDPYDRDSDDDGLTDGEEARHIGRVALYKAPDGTKFHDRHYWPDPALWDTDGDGLADGLELGVNSKIDSCSAHVYHLAGGSWTTGGDPMVIGGTEGDGDDDYIHDTLGYAMRDGDFDDPED